MNALRLLCVANLSQGHVHRFLELVGNTGIDVHLLDRARTRAPNRLPLASHDLWPRGYRRTLTSLSGGSVGSHLSDAIIRRRVTDIWRRRRARVCHVHWVDDRAWHCARAGLRPLVLTAYGSDLNWTRLPDHDPSSRRQKAEALAACDLFIADSKDMIELASELAGREINARLLPFGINTDLFCPGYKREASAWRAQLNIPDTATVVLSPRLLRTNYRHDVILQAFADAITHHGGEAYLIFKRYLSDEACVDRLLTMASERGIRDRIRILDEVPYERMPILYAMADVAVNFPVMDAFPVTFLECGACQLPVLTNGLPAYGSNGIRSFLHIVDDEAALSRAIVLSLAGLHTGDLEAWRACVVTQFDERFFVSQLMDAYDSVLDAGEAR